MKLPGRLRDTTLGDLLGTLHRNQASGRLQLIETMGPANGRTHFVEFEDGQITQIETDRPGPRIGELLELDLQARRALPAGGSARIGEYLLRAGLVTPDKLRSVLHQQLRLRLDELFEIKDAIILFRIPRPRFEDPTSPAPLEKTEFLEGRPRAKARREPVRRGMLCGQEGCRGDALAVLGLPENATERDVHHAFRRLAHEAHPDRYPEASAEQKRVLLSRFASLSRAYHALTG